MPDNMTPEKSSVDVIRSLGPTPEQIKQSQGPEWKSDLPDIKMQINNPFGPPNPNAPSENGDEHRAEDEANSRFYYRQGESLSSELIASAEEPQELFMGLRSLEKMLEDGNIPSELSERYTPPRQLSLMYERAEVLGMPTDDLIKNGFIKPDTYIQNSGEGVPRKTKFAALALSVEQKVKNQEYVYTYKFGTPEKRAEMAKAYEKAVLELEARSIMGDHITLRLNLDYRDSLEGLTYMLHSGRMPKFRADHLEALFNMPGVTELATNPENHQLGDQLEEAMFLNLVMLNSGSQQRMQDFLERPGAKHLIAKLAKEGGATYDDWVKVNIGDVKSWVDDNVRLPADEKNSNGTTTPATFKVETEKGKRGTLTKWGNISAFGGGPGEFGSDKELEFIEGAVGKLVGSNEASWLAATLMRVIGAYASEGYVALPNGKSCLPLGEGRYISGDDTGKFWAYMFNYKEGMKGRPSGLKDMIGRIPDMAMNLFDWSQVRVDDVKDKNGDPVKRSVWDAWLGTTGNKIKIDLLTGKPTNDVNQKTVEEPYHRLGDLNFKSLDRDFHGTFSVMQWLMGNAERPTGIFIDAMRVEGFRPEDFSLNELKKKVKYFQICLNSVVLTKGSQHLYTNVGESAPKIQKNFLRNLMSARILSSSFAQDVLGSTTKLFNPKTANTVEVSNALLFDAFINKALKGDPKSEAEIVENYIDENLNLRKAGTLNQVDQFLYETKDKFENEVGRVTGRKAR